MYGEFEKKGLDSNLVCNFWQNQDDHLDLLELLLEEKVIEEKTLWG